MAPRTCRLARTSDLSRVLPLVAAYYAYDSIDFDAEKLRAALSHLLKDKTLGRVWVIESGRGLIAYAVVAFSFDLEFGGREAMITDLFVSARYRRRGLGACLLGAIMKFCRRAALYELELNVTRGDRDALAFYKSLGFRDRKRTVLTLEVEEG